MSELVDVVDAEDRVIGVIPRERLAEGAANHRVVHVILWNERGEILLQEPAAARGKTFALGSSVAGHVRAGESYSQAAARETLEELGQPARELREAGTTWLDEGGRRKFVGVFVGAAPRAPSPDPGEVAALRYAPPAEIRNLLRDAPATFSPTFARVFRHLDAGGYLQDAPT